MEKDSNGMPTYRTKRCQINDITTGEFYYRSSNRALVKNSSMALRCAWNSSMMCILFQHQSLRLQKQQNDLLDGWEVFVTTLISMIPLTIIPTSTSISTMKSTLSNEKIAALYTRCINKAYVLQKEPQENGTNYYITDPQNLALVIRSLHVLYQDYYISKFTPKESMTLLGSLLWILACIVRSKSWISCYCKYDFWLKEPIPYQLDSAILKQDCGRELPPIDEGLILLGRPFIFESWIRYHLPHDSTTSLPQLCGVPTLDPIILHQFSAQDEKLGTDTLNTTSIISRARGRKDEFAFKLKMIWYIHQTMHSCFSNTDIRNYPITPPLLPISECSAISVHPSSSRLLDMRRQEWVEAIVKKGYCRNDLEMVPDTSILLAPLLNTLAYLQLNPPTGQSMEFYRFIGRNDMVAQLDHHQTSSIMNSTTSLSSYDLKLLRFPFDKKNGHQQNVSQLIAPSTMSHAGLSLETILSNRAELPLQSTVLLPT
ncbi:unnamed protein product [Absidia cylindrospora]